ncbi:blocked early in transport 5 [Dermatophagoides pteronyssinus]|uniref:Trafficking protein particle complex subunit n=1 Tax=Dermatophagoides pteronyssinus TaxID=6956 RepID=A0ABQ8J2G8_DERPT|nr:Trafficking protein particle complex subunit 1 [Dermatophagoides pteronyssinus]
MAIYNFHIFDGSGNCLFSLTPSDKSTEILYGFLYSLKSFVQRISPSLQMDNNFFFYQTSDYNLVFYEFATSIKFVLITSYDMKRDSQFYREMMIQLHKRVYVEYHVKNAIASCKTIDSQLFRQQLTAFLAQNIKQQA